MIYRWLQTLRDYQRWKHPSVQHVLSGGLAMKTCQQELNPVFLAAYNPKTGVSREAQTAIHEGSQYLWNKHFTRPDVSILKTGKDMGPEKGLPGAVLCLGEPQDRTCHASILSCAYAAAGLVHLHYLLTCYISCLLARSIASSFSITRLRLTSIRG